VAQGWPALHARLAEVDPAAARRIEPTDPQRIQRALEIYELTGEPQSAWFQRPVDNALPCRPVKVVLSLADRAVLHGRIEARLRAMLAAGFVEEVERLYRRGDLHPDLPAMRAVGYRQVWEYLAGAVDYDTMAQKAVFATRQFAKRQLTWLRNADPASRFAADDAEIDPKVLKYLTANAIC
jgi:tRNA dimethylallyltransferase